MSLLGSNLGGAQQEVILAQRGAHVQAVWRVVDAAGARSGAGAGVEDLSLIASSPAAAAGRRLQVAASPPPPPRLR